MVEWTEVSGFLVILTPQSTVYWSHIHPSTLSYRVLNRQLGVKSLLEIFYDE